MNTDYYTPLRVYKDYWIAYDRALPRQRIVVEVVRLEKDAPMAGSVCYKHGDPDPYEVNEFEFIAKLKIELG